MMRESLAYFAAQKLTGPAEAPYNGRFLVGAHHQTWSDLVADHERLCILAPRDHGKSLCYQGLILRSDGCRIPAGEWQGGEVLAFNEKTHRFELDYAPASKKLPKEPCYQIRTKSGRDVDVNGEHKFKTWSKWVRADEIQVGARIAVPRRIPIDGGKPVEGAWLLGVLVGDGSLTQQATLTNQKPAVQQAAIAQAKAFGWKWSSTDDGVRFKIGYSDPREWLSHHGLFKCGAYKKRVPKALFVADEASIIDFLSGYADTDAHVNLKAGGSIEYYSVSQNLLKDAQHLLLRVGIVGALTKKKGQYKGKDHWSWRLTIRGDDALRFCEVMRLESDRTYELDQLADLLESREASSGPALDRFPREVWQHVQHSEDWFRKRKLPRPNRQYAPTRSKLQKIAEAEENKALLAAVDGDVFWDEVVEVKKLGLQHVYGIQVQRLQNYLANDIVQHNTYFFDFAYPIWQAWREPGSIGFIFSATKEQAIRILEDIKAEVETNPELQYLFPTGPNKKWSSTYIKFSNGSRIYARGFGTKVRGAHPNWIVCDDVLNDETAWSETTRTKQVEYFYNAITNMITPNGQIVVIGTPFHALDLYGDLQKNEEYHFQRFQAINPKTKQALWPDRYNEERLARRHREIKSIRFTREFMCSPISDDMSLFPSYLFKGPPMIRTDIKLGMPGEFWEAAGIETYMGVDFALSSSVSADYTVIFVMGVDKYGNRWIVDMQRYHGLAYESQKAKIIEMGKKYDCALIFLESNQMQRIWGDQLIVETDLPVKKFITTGQEKNSLEKGLPSLRILLENKKFRIPMGDSNSAELMGIWMSEMRDFTWQQGKVTSIGEHDDTAMACWICDQAIRQGYFSYAFGEDEDIEEKINLDEMVNAMIQEPEDDPEKEAEKQAEADGFNPFSELEKHLEDSQSDLLEEMMASHKEQQKVAPSIGYGDEDDGEPDLDDIFSGMPLKKNGGGWTPKSGW